MRYTGFTAALIIFSLFSACKQSNSKGVPPNILLINADDLGWADLGYMGSTFYESPNIDSLAKEGLIFTQGYAAAANCAPSRACMMTGLNTPWHGIYTVGSPERGDSRDRKIIPVKNNVTLHDSLTTLAEVLSVYGYTTCQAGKWHLSDDSRDHGFNYNIGGSHAGHPVSYYPPYGNIDLDAANGEYLTDNIMDHVLQFLDARQGDPFFLYYAPYAVHTPIHKVDSMMEKFSGKTGPEGMNNIEYATMIYNLDRNIGRLITKLKELNLYNNTLIIFTSDNGGSFRISQQKPLRAGKGSYYEGGIRVPLFFSWPGRIKAGINEDVPIVNMVIFPTILEIIEAKLPDKVYDGVSLAPLLLKGRKPEIRPLYWHFPIYLERGNSDSRDPLFRTRPGSAIRFGDWKLLSYYEDGETELFNLKNDPGEMQNLAAERPDKLVELVEMLEDWISTVKAPVPTEANPDYIPN